MNRHLLYLLVAILLLGLPASNLSGPALAAPPPPGTPSTAAEVERAVRQAIAGNEVGAMAYLIYETQVDGLTISQDNTRALAYLAPVDPQTGEVVPTEPALVPVLREGDAWQAVLPGDARWVAAVTDLPDELISDEIRAFYLALEAETSQLAPDGPLGGYLLPWAGGKSIVLTRSVAHDADITSGNAHYAFDFSTSPSQLFDLYAAKAGTVYSFRDSCTNGDSSCSNWIVLQDISTTPVTYQLYLHLAQGSIPSALKIIGAPVARGQFIGVADDTGASTNHHLHFQVQTLLYESYYWGKSVDIVFEDVSINGGRPRTNLIDEKRFCLSTDVCDVFQMWYTSQNYPNGDRWPPNGGITSPANDTNITASTLRLSGWAWDVDSGMGSAQFIANYDGTWREVGERMEEVTEFSTTWDLCADEVPDGPISLALRLQDSVGNYTLDLLGLRHMTKAYECAAEDPPVCVPDADQIALFSKPDFGGECSVVGQGNFSSINTIGDVGSNEAASIQVGKEVWATVYTDDGFEGRSQTLTASDANLDDNPVGAAKISSLRVQPSGQKPAAPKLYFPSNGASIKYVALSWTDSGGAIDYQVQVSGPVSVRTSPWRKVTGWAPGELASGDYTWKVKARNSNGESDWSAERDFTISSTTLSANPQTAPYLSGFETTEERSLWDQTNNWDWTDQANHTPDGDASWTYDVGDAVNGYDNGDPTGGDLTSPPITIPSKGFFLRFWYQYETEGAGPYWDQRHVQISTDGQNFAPLYQLWDDVEKQWMQSPAINLDDYAGKTVWVRFHFETVDEDLNAFQGWFVDDFSIYKETDPPQCGLDGNDTPASATTLSVGGQVQAVLCPTGDIDYYKFTAKKGDRIGAATLAQELGSPLDTTLALLDGDGGSVLAYNDDRVLYEQPDSLLYYRITRDGSYYLKVRAWNHPSAGGDDYTYTLRLFNDQTPPSASFDYPRSGLVLPHTPIQLRLQADDGTGTGVSHVEFLWHSGDWLDGEWQEAGQDWDGSDGWSLTFDTSNLTDQMGLAFYVKVYDWAGNWIGLGAWNLTLDGKAAHLPLVRR